MPWTGRACQQTLMKLWCILWEVGISLGALRSRSRTSWTQPGTKLSNGETLWLLTSKGSILPMLLKVTCCLLSDFYFKSYQISLCCTVPGKPEGMVRVIRDGYPDRIILKGFRGFVRDLSFAFHEKRILVAAVDEYGYVLVFEIVGSSPSLVLQVNPDGITTSSDNHRIVWCQYVPESPNSFGTFADFFFYYANYV